MISGPTIIPSRKTTKTGTSGSLTIRPGESIDRQVFLGHYLCGDESHLGRRVFVESAGKPIDLELWTATIK